VVLGLSASLFFLVSNTTGITTANTTTMNANVKMNQKSFRFVNGLHWGVSTSLASINSFAGVDKPEGT
jgi:hypothetical protein